LWAWHSAETNGRGTLLKQTALRKKLRNLQAKSLIVYEISRSSPDGQTDGQTDRRQTDMARSTRLTLPSACYILTLPSTLWGRKSFLLSVTYFPTNLVCYSPSEKSRTPFTLRVMGIARQNAIVEVPRLSDTRDLANAQIPVTQLKLQREMEICKQYRRYTDLTVWALEWAWHCVETNLRCVGSSGICTPYLTSTRGD